MSSNKGQSPAQHIHQLAPIAPQDRRDLEDMLKIDIIGVVQFDMGHGPVLLNARKS